jgi:putative PIN family toxin of toxin-antitoxin system
MTSRSACVFDTNSLISALLVRTSTPREAFDKALDHYQILVSEETMEEFDDVAGREKFASYLEEGERERFEELLYREATYVSVDVTVTESRDPDDDKFLELAVAGEATVIVSGDSDLLTLDPFRDIRIVSPRAFVEEFPP